MDKAFYRSRSAKVALGLLLALLSIRFAMLDIFPLYDTTEARYAEIARIMQETSNWVTPQIDYHKPFWGKPPMHTWLSAASFQALGVSAFSARLPHFLCGLLVLLLVFNFLGDLKGRQSALFGCLVLSSSLGFIVSMGMVMTDTALLLSMTLAMISFWKAYAEGEKGFHGHLFFIALAMGMLVKGPVAVVLVGIALLVWTSWQKNLKEALKSLPWVSGILLFLVLTLPWYLWAERRSPGFLEYFLIGEHLQRFLVPGWEGDLYGAAHDKPRGTIWLFWLLAAFPWSLFLIKRLFTAFFRSSAARVIESGSQRMTPYLVSWMLSPVLLFTLSGNILIAYVIPGFSAMAILVAMQGKMNRYTLSLAALTTSLIASVPVANHLNVVSKTSEIELLGNTPTQYSSHPLYYWKRVPFSAEFYSRGQARKLQESKALTHSIGVYGGAYLAIRLDEIEQVDQASMASCVEQKRTSARVLLFCENKNEVVTR